MVRRGKTTGVIWMQGWGGQIFVRKATVVKPNIWKMLRMMGDLLFLRRYGCNYIWLAIKYKRQAFWPDTG